MLITIFIVSFFLSRPHDWLVRMKRMSDKKSAWKLKSWVHHQAISLTPTLSLFRHLIKSKWRFFLLSVVVASFAFSSFIHSLVAWWQFCHVLQQKGVIMKCTRCDRKHKNSVVLKFLMIFAIKRFFWRNFASLKCNRLFPPKKIAKIHHFKCPCLDNIHKFTVIYHFVHSLLRTFCPYIIITVVVVGCRLSRFTM